MAINHLTDTYRGLCAAIVESPDDDMPRLALADYLQGLDTERQWCENCKGTGWEPGREGHENCSDCLGAEPDKSNHDRAELIRLQCKFDCSECGGRDGEVGPCGLTDYYQKCYTCRGRREDEARLIAANEDKWRKGPQCRHVGWSLKYVPGLKITSAPACPICCGTEDAGGLLVPFVPTNPSHDPNSQREVSYRRGMKRVQARFSHCIEYVNNRAQPTAWLRSVLRHHPDVVEVELDDRPPLSRQRFRGRIVPGIFFYSDRSDSTSVIETLPESLCNFLGVPCQRDSFGIGADDMYGFATHYEAVTALARAVVKWARASIGADK